MGQVCHQYKHLSLKSEVTESTNLAHQCRHASFNSPKEQGPEQYDIGCVTQSLAGAALQLCL